MENINLGKKYMKSKKINANGTECRHKILKVMCTKDSDQLRCNQEMKTQSAEDSKADDG